MFSNGRDNNATRMVVMCVRKWRAAIARDTTNKNSFPENEFDNAAFCRARCSCRACCRFAADQVAACGKASAWRLLICRLSPPLFSFAAA
ncbi:MAG: hypothetical protein J0I13_04310 [Rhizobiales bacterium]|jgi:hypothetical protein|nr:hypothetical protein [Hyphomicrobiales bacterium]